MELRLLSLKAALYFWQVPVTAVVALDSKVKHFVRIPTHFLSSDEKRVRRYMPLLCRLLLYPSSYSSCSLTCNRRPWSLQSSDAFTTTLLAIPGSLTLFFKRVLTIYSRTCPRRATTLCSFRKTIPNRLAKSFVYCKQSTFIILGKGLTEYRYCRCCYYLLTSGDDRFKQEFSLAGFLDYQRNASQLTQAPKDQNEDLFQRVEKYAYDDDPKYMSGLPTIINGWVERQLAEKTSSSWDKNKLDEEFAKAKAFYYSSYVKKVVSVPGPVAYQTFYPYKIHRAY